MELVIRNVILTALTSVILIMDSGCNQCGPNSGGLFIQEAWGDWQLVRETRPALTLTSFSTIRSLQIKSGGDRNGNAVTKERWLLQKSKRPVRGHFRFKIAVILAISPVG